ncbi:MAG: hypothetical protein IPH16_03780 [Haliscomenobacter sp.]|nr:hypothetical protein [Haliscomenobacter sp.]
MRLQNILLAETSSWFAVNKPSGISVERQPGASDTLEDLALNYAGGKKEFGSCTGWTGPPAG